MRGRSSPQVYYVPEGRLKIARRFNAGNDPFLIARSPRGTTEALPRLAAFQSCLRHFASEFRSSPASELAGYRRWSLSGPVWRLVAPMRYSSGLRLFGLAGMWFHVGVDPIGPAWLKKYSLFHSS
jgi:hypothetical protein